MITYVRHPTTTRHYWKAGSAVALAAIAAAGLAAGPAQAEVSDFSGFSEERQLSDAELARLRGRFVDKGRILFFGVQMSSEWRTSAGEQLMAGATLRGDLSGASPSVSFEPRLTAVTPAGGSAGSATGNGAIVHDAGTGNVSGVAQSIQAGGNFNAAANDLQIDVLNAADYGGAGQGAEATSRQQRLPSGTRLAVSSGAGGMGVRLDVPGMGRATQAIVPGRGLRQSIQLTSDAQQVRNLTRLQLYMGDRGANAGVPGLRSAVESARGLRR
ncbi:MAG: hypothetical protein L0J54_09765 [Halomonas sp.]|nr:hypothetical protein [Halomonas sp.]MDN6298293.1 hypothetical protein [Halomonas sp.]MDN6315538.1 hypothetical protein [Halomonas sp.]MDN6336885.1 hypothetical protein [Halomonas sp.]